MTGFLDAMGSRYRARVSDATTHKLVWGVDSVSRIAAAFATDDARRLLASRGRLAAGSLAAMIDGERDWFVGHLAEHHADLARAFAAVETRRFPGRAEALLTVARALGCRLPESEYQLPEATLSDLLQRARALVGARIPTSGAAGHKGRVGDGVERLLMGGRMAGKHSDHPEAEIKSVPVLGGDVLERVKLGVVSARSNPLEKCRRVLFVFVEQRGDDHFIRGLGLREFDDAAWRAMWRDGWLVETAAGTTRQRARGLYLVPRWFRAAGLWPA